MMQDLTIIELTQILAGPLCGMFFAELGARVVKVESPEGDPTRKWYSAHEDMQTDTPAYFCCCNWGKESIALDLHIEKDKELLYRMVSTADIVTHSMRPGKAESTGTDYETLSSFNDSLIYLSISAYGADDPRPGLDAIIQAESGFTYMNGEADGPPVKMPVALIDILLAHQAKEALLLALLERMKTGKGRHIHVSLHDVALSSLANQATNFLMTGSIPQRLGSSHPNIAPYGSIFYTKDKKAVVLAIGNDRQFEHACSLLGLPNVPNDTRFKRNKDRVQHRKELEALLSKAIASFDRTSLLQLCKEEEVMIGAVRSLDEVFAEEDTEHLLLSNATHKGIRSFTPTGFSSEKTLLPPPQHNMHGEKLRKEFSGDSWKGITS